jgi:hypothetical protein
MLRINFDAILRHAYLPCHFTSGLQRWVIRGRLEMLRRWFCILACLGMASYGARPMDSCRSRGETSCRDAPGRLASESFPSTGTDAFANGGASGDGLSIGLTWQFSYSGILDTSSTTNGSAMPPMFDAQPKVSPRGLTLTNQFFNGQQQRRVLCPIPTTRANRFC